MQFSFSVEFAHEFAVKSLNQNIQNASEEDGQWLLLNEEKTFLEIVRRFPNV